MEKDNASGQVTLTFNRDSVVNIVLVAEFILLLIFGWQLYQIKEVLEDNGIVSAQTSLNQGPIKKNPDAPDGPPQPSETAGPIEMNVTANDHIRGDKNAPVTIVEYSDFECPFCANAAPTMEQILSEYDGQVRLVYRHFPLSFHPQAQKAGEAAECAGDQGKFWEYHDILFANQTRLAGGVNQLKAWAGELGLNQSQFDQCLDNNDKADDVKNDLIDGTQKGVTGTPGFFVNGTLVTGAQPFSVFQQAIEAELAK